MATSRAETSGYEALYNELMRKPVPREGFTLPKRLTELLRCDDQGVDPYARWVEALNSQSETS